MPNQPFRVMTPDALTNLNTADRTVDDAVVDAGHRPPTERVTELVAAGHTVRVRCDPAPGGPTGACPEGVTGHECPSTPPIPGSAPALAGTVPVDVAEEVALAAAYAWAGARAFVTRYPERVRRALDMVASIRGERPPSAVRRGLV
ncbi:hypothetical protein [Nocardiopsis listeri]|uniref:hypothetical protein n=1 Tax=Nocardiopsis listeri TaxID=53440 RepID=UPI0008323D3B|nr:hypothetical protein [Nocardiopsis listeri]